MHIITYFYLVLIKKYLKALFYRADWLVKDACACILRASYSKALIVLGDV